MTVIANADSKIWFALKTRIDQWVECDIQYPMETYSPVSTDSFIIIQHVATEYGGPLPIQVECGQPLTGFLNISVLVPTTWNFGQLIGRAGRVADFFPNGAKYKYLDMTVSINGRSRVIGGVALNAPWNRVEVQVPFMAWG